MKQSQLFTKTTKEVPAGEVAKNAQLLIRAGFVRKEMAGVYAYLPLGLRVLNKIMGVIREEMEAIGGQEVLMTGLQDKSVWETSGRWSDEVSDAWFKTNLQNGTELGLGWTHEEPMTNMLKASTNSYKDLPVAVFQFQTKFRNELRAKSGIMRSREFIMKDLYSFSKTKEEHEAFYEKAKQAYERIFERLGLGDVTYFTFASGGAFSKYSHEFQTITDAGEDIIYVDEAKGIAVNEEVYTDEVLEQLELKREDLVQRKAVEVGNIFTLGERFSKPFEYTYKDENGEDQLVFMGSYGIGPGRSMGTVVEVLSDEKGMVWPKEIAPFSVHLVQLFGRDEEVNQQVEMQASDLYEALQKVGIEVLWDDRKDLSPGAKFADADLIGIPLRVVISERSLEAGGVEWKERTSTESRIVSLEEIVEEIDSWRKA